MHVLLAKLRKERARGVEATPLLWGAAMPVDDVPAAWGLALSLALVSEFCVVIAAQSFRFAALGGAPEQPAPLSSSLVGLEVAEAHARLEPRRRRASCRGRAFFFCLRRRACGPEAAAEEDGER